MRIGIVAEVHHNDHSVDIVMADDGSRIVGAQVLTKNGSTRSGSVDLPEVKPAGKDKWDVTKRSGQDLRAIVGYVSGHPVVLGFLYPQVNQMLLKDGKAARYRHQSDVETLIDGDGNMQITHPSGTYIRIGESPDKDDMAGKFTDDSATDRNTGKQVSVRIGMAGGTAVLTIAPGGQVTLTTQAGVSVTADGDVTVKSPHVTLDTPTTTMTGNCEVQGSLSIAGSTTSVGDVTGAGVSLQQHRHTEQGDGQTTSPPV